MSFTKRLVRRFRDFAFRHSYVETFVDSALATQVQVLREQRGWTQAELAERTGMRQSQISRIENVNNSSLQIRTLKRLAQTFDLALVVRFESFGNVLPHIEGFSRQSLERYSFQDDPEICALEDRASTGRQDLPGALPTWAVLQQACVNLRIGPDQDADSFGTRHVGTLQNAA